MYLEKIFYPIMQYIHSKEFNTDVVYMVKSVMQMLYTYAVHTKCFAFHYVTEWNRSREQLFMRQSVGTF